MKMLGREKEEFNSFSDLANAVGTENAEKLKALYKYDLRRTKCFSRLPHLK